MLTTLTAQALLTITFNVVCIGYTTLSIANLVCGLCEEWMRLRNKPIARDSEALKEAEDTSKYDSSFDDLDTPSSVDLLQTSIPFGWDYLEPRGRDIEEKLELLEDQHWTIRQLKALAKERHIPCYGRMTKAQLIDVLFQ